MARGFDTLQERSPSLLLSHQRGSQHEDRRGASRSSRVGVRRAVVDALILRTQGEATFVGPATRTASYLWAMPALAGPASGMTSTSRKPASLHQRVRSAPV
jgi:hypothetical protein